MNRPTFLPPLLAKPRPAHLVLADGTVFSGWGAGPPGTTQGEVVFNTSMTGYQEMLSDPSYHGQILVLTTSHVGQVGSNAADSESGRAWARALVVQQLDRVPSSWRNEAPLEDWLEAQGLSVGWGFDTRSIVQHVRTHGAIPGVLDTSGAALEELIETARAARGTDGCDLAAEVSCRSAYDWDSGPWPHEAERSAPADGPLVAVLDLGVKRSILRRLVGAGCRVSVLPAATTAAELGAGGYAGLVLSNGPGDPAAVAAARALAESALGRLPILGICLGHQILGLALGGRTLKLPYGHHGGNHPVRELRSGQVLITAQNHNYAVQESSLPREVEVSHINLTDGTVEGLALPRLRVEALQFHPEAAPGPNDAAHIFDRFAQRCREVE